MQAKPLDDYMFERTVSLETQLQEQQSDIIARAAARLGWLMRLFSPSS
jgi:hypothetical protein